MVCTASVAMAASPCAMSMRSLIACPAVSILEEQDSAARCGTVTTEGAPS